MNCSKRAIERSRRSIASRSRRRDLQQAQPQRAGFSIAHRQQRADRRFHATRPALRSRDRRPPSGASPRWRPRRTSQAGTPACCRTARRTSCARRPRARSRRPRASRDSRPRRPLRSSPAPGAGAGSGAPARARPVPPAGAALTRQLRGVRPLRLPTARSRFGLVWPSGRRARLERTPPSSAAARSLTKAIRNTLNRSIVL